MSFSGSGIRSALALAAMLVLSFEQRAAAAFVSYREVFGNSSTNPIGNAGWQGHVASTAVASASSTPSTALGPSNDWFLSGGDGDNRGLDNLNKHRRQQPHQRLCRLHRHRQDRPGLDERIHRRPLDQ